MFVLVHHQSYCKGNCVTNQKHRLHSIKRTMAHVHLTYYAMHAGQIYLIS